MKPAGHTPDHHADHHHDIPHRRLSQVCMPRVGMAQIGFGLPRFGDWVERRPRRPRPPAGKPALPPLGGGVPADAADRPADAAASFSTSAPASFIPRCCWPASG